MRLIACTIVFGAVILASVGYWLATTEAYVPPPKQAAYQPKYCFDGGPPDSGKDWENGREHYFFYLPCAWSDEIIDL